MVQKILFIMLFIYSHLCIYLKGISARGSMATEKIKEQEQIEKIRYNTTCVREIRKARNPWIVVYLPKYLTTFVDLARKVH